MDNKIKEELLAKGWTEEDLYKYGMRDIKGFEGLYAVTSCGKVYSYKANLFLAGSVSKDKYHRVSLRKQGKTYTIERHRLVAEAYIPNPDNLPEVNHKTEIKSKNYVNGLEWCSRKYNANYGTGIDRAKQTRIKNGTIKKPTRFINGMSVREASEKTGIPVQTLYWRMHQNWSDDEILKA